VENRPSHPPRLTGLRLIAVAKIAKGFLLLGLGFGAWRAINANLGDLIRQATEQLRIDPENRYVRIAIERVANVDPRQIRNFGFLSFLFAADLFVEGIGLWMNKTWAKYLVLVATGGFVPLEAYACVQHATLLRWVILAANVAVVATIAHHLWHSRGSKEA
jgi:uncharacterized membrane protein (DUF2068 family)